MSASNVIELPVGFSDDGRRALRSRHTRILGRQSLSPCGYATCIVDGLNSGEFHDRGDGPARTLALLLQDDYGGGLAAAAEGCLARSAGFRTHKTHPRLEAMPSTLQDVVIVFVTVSGRKGGGNVQESYANKIYARTVGGVARSAIQLTTAAGICTVLDLLADGRLPARGFVRQEDVRLDAFLANRFGRTYATAPSATREAVGKQVSCS